MKAKTILKALSVVFALALVVTGFVFFKAPADTASAAPGATAPTGYTAPTIPDYSSMSTIEVYACANYAAYAEAKGLATARSGLYGSATNPFTCINHFTKAFINNASFRAGTVFENAVAGKTRIVVHLLGDILHLNSKGDTDTIDDGNGMIAGTSITIADAAEGNQANFCAYGAVTSQLASMKVGGSRSATFSTQNVLVEFVGENLGTDASPRYPTIWLQTTGYDIMFMDDYTFENLNIRSYSEAQKEGNDAPASTTVPGSVASPSTFKDVTRFSVFGNVFVIKNNVHFYSGANEENATIYGSPVNLGSIDNLLKLLFTYGTNGTNTNATSKYFKTSGNPTAFADYSRFTLSKARTFEIHSGTYDLISAFGMAKYKGNLTYNAAFSNVTMNSFNLGSGAFETTVVSGNGPTFNVKFGAGTKILGAAKLIGDDTVKIGTTTYYINEYFYAPSSTTRKKAADTDNRAFDVNLYVDLGATGKIGDGMETVTGSKNSPQTGIFGGLSCSNKSISATVGETTYTFGDSANWTGDLNLYMISGTVSNIAGNRGNAGSSTHTNHVHTGDVNITMYDGDVERFVTPNYGTIGNAATNKNTLTVYGGSIGFGEDVTDNSRNFRGVIGSGGSYTAGSETTVNIYGGRIFALDAVLSVDGTNNASTSFSNVTVNIQALEDYDAPVIGSICVVGTVGTTNFSYGNIQATSPVSDIQVNLKDGAGKDGKTARVSSNFFVIGYRVYSTQIDNIEVNLGTLNGTADKPVLPAAFTVQPKYTVSTTAATNVTVNFNGVTITGDIKGITNFINDPNTSTAYTGATLGAREWNADEGKYDTTDGLTFVFNGGTYSGAISGVGWSVDVNGASVTCLHPDEKLKVFKIEINDGTFSGVISAAGNESKVGYAEIEINGGTFTETCRISAINFSVGGDATNKEAVVDEYYLNIPATSTATFANPAWNLTSSASSEATFARTKPTVNDFYAEIKGGTFAPSARLSVDTTATSDDSKFTVTIADVAPVIYSETETGLTHTVTRKAGNQVTSEQLSEIYTFDLETWVLGTPRTDGRTIRFDAAFGARFLFDKTVFDSANLSNIDVAVTVDGNTTHYAVGDLRTNVDGYYDLFVAGIAPKDIDKVITVVVTATYGSETLTDTFNDSVKAALDQVVADTKGTFTPAFHNAAQATLEYAQAAADQFLGEGVKEYWTGEAITDVQPGAEIATYSTGSGDITIMGTSLVLKDEVAIKFWADASAFAGTIDGVTVKINGVAAEVVKEINSGTRHYWTFKVSVPISELSAAQSVQIFQGADAVSNVYTDSVYNYAVCAVTPAYNMSEAEVETGHAILNYISYVNTYLTEQ